MEPRRRPVRFSVGPGYHFAVPRAGADLTRLGCPAGADVSPGSRECEGSCGTGMSGSIRPHNQSGILHPSF